MRRIIIWPRLLRISSVDYCFGKHPWRIFCVSGFLFRKFHTGLFCHPVSCLVLIMRRSFSSSAHSMGRDGYAVISCISVEQILKKCLQQLSVQNRHSCSVGLSSFPCMGPTAENSSQIHSSSISCLLKDPVLSACTLCVHSPVHILGVKDLLRDGKSLVWLSSTVKRPDGENEPDPRKHSSVLGSPAP